MHTNWCVLIEISMKIGMLNFLSGIIGHCTEGRISLLWSQLNFKPFRRTCAKLWTEKYESRRCLDIFLLNGKSTFFFILQHNSFWHECFHMNVSAYIFTREISVDYQMRKFLIKHTSCSFYSNTTTLESGINVHPWINVAPWKIWQKE